VSNRVEALKSLAEQNPRDNFVRYALAMAYADAGEFERALEEFGVLLSLNPDYKAAYFHAGQALEKLGRLEEARQMYRRGIEVTTRQGDAHAREQLAGALELLG
jgi:tetratricopeptide (TPR) repeat protein